jgi:hypothetical protein
MGGGNTPPAGPRPPADNHAAVRLLAVLVMTPEDELLEFKRRCLDDESAVNAAQLGAAREVLLALSAALRDGDEDDWRRIERARDMLGRAPADDEEASVGRVPTSAPPIAPSVPLPSAPAPLPQAPRPHAPLPPAPAPQAPPPAPPIQDTTQETVGISQLSPVAGLAVPFSGTKSAPDRSPEDVEGESAPEAGSTASLGMENPVAGLAIPFETEPSSGTSPPELTLEQYASLRASCDVEPTSKARIERQYGIRDAGQRQALDARWRAHLDAHPDENARFEQLLAQYRDWVRRQGRDR